LSKFVAIFFGVKRAVPDRGVTTRLLRTSVNEIAQHQTANDAKHPAPSENTAGDLSILDLLLFKKM